MSQQDAQFLTDYAPGYIAEILRTVKTIAMVGASADSRKPSYQVMRVLLDAGYDVIPVNPRRDLTEIHGQKVYPRLASIGRPVDMVDVFRPSSVLYGVTEEAIAIGAKVLWAQIGIADGRAAKRAHEAGLKVVMDRCPKIELMLLEDDMPT